MTLFQLRKLSVASVTRQLFKNFKGNFERFLDVIVYHVFSLKGEAKITESVISQQIFIQKAPCQKRKVGGDYRYAFSENSLQDLFKN